MHPFWDIGRLSYWASWGLKGALGGPGTPGSLAHASSGAAVGTVVEAQQGLTGSQPKSGCHVGISLACLGLSGSIVARESGKPELNYIARQCLSACLASFCWPFSGWDRGKDVKDYYTAWPKVVGIDAVSSPPMTRSRSQACQAAPSCPCVAQAPARPVSLLRTEYMDDHSFFEDTMDEAIGYRSSIASHTISPARSVIMILFPRISWR